MTGKRKIGFPEYLSVIVINMYIKFYSENKQIVKDNLITIEVFQEIGIDVLRIKNYKQREFSEDAVVKILYFEVEEKIKKYFSVPVK